MAGEGRRPILNYLDGVKRILRSMSEGIPIAQDYLRNDRPEKARETLTYLITSLRQLADQLESLPFD